jgi:hypothetical protein
MKANKQYALGIDTKKLTLRMCQRSQNTHPDHAEERRERTENALREEEHTTIA